jgi:hypothetical protein
LTHPLPNDIQPSHNAPVDTSTEAHPGFSDVNALDDATYHPSPVSTTPDPEDAFEAGNVPHQPGKLSTASNLRSVSFKEMTGRHAGTPTDNPPAPNLSQSDQPNPSLFPFQSEFDYALAMFFHQGSSQKAMLPLSSRTKGLVLSSICSASMVLMNGMRN